MYEKIPNELKQIPNWVCWLAVPDEKAHSGFTKVPINPRTGGQAMSNNPSTWTDFDTAVKASMRFSGIGFMFGECDYFGVDIDDRREILQQYLDGDTDNIFGEFINTLQSYAELSPSGNGIHIICRGSLPKGRRNSKVNKVEMYDNVHFFTMTGNICSEFAETAECTESVKPLHAKYLGGGHEPKPAPRVTVNLDNVNDIVQTAMSAKNGAQFSALYRGDLSAYGSQSEADLAFCNMLAFWCGCDASKMDIIFRQSGLMREKWDRKQSGTTYGALTIEKAIAGCTEVYSPRKTDGYTLTIGGENAVQVKHYSFDDMGNAARFVDLFGENVRYCYTEKAWYYYDTQKWKADKEGAVERMADRAVQAMNAELKIYAETDANEGTDMQKPFEKHIKHSRSNKSKKAMLAEVQHHVPVMPNQMDKYKMALNTPSGVIDLRTGEIKPHDPAHYFTKITPVDYSSHADCPRWLSFLDEIFGGDKDLIRYIQKALGYSLTGSTAEQCIFFLLGSGKNGKSTFLDVVRDVYGDYAANIQPETIMVRKNAGSAINSDIARLKGARFVTSAEPDEAARLNEGLVKQLTGGDAVTARKLYAEEFEFKPEFKLWMATNHKPIIRGTDTGIWRRIHIIPFNVQIPDNKVDRNLIHKLKAEMTSIFRWILDGCALWQSEGLKMPRAVLDMVREYRREMDVVSAFIEDCCIRDGSVAAKTLYAAYCQWANDNNEFHMSNTKFGVEMARNYEKVKTREGWFYTNLSLING
jgi:putative DNA primase/helicase